MEVAQEVPTEVTHMGSGQAMHPSIVPRAFAWRLTKPVLVGEVKVTPDQLLDWQFAALPSEEAKDAAASAILARLRASPPPVAEVSFRFAQGSSEARLLSARDGSSVRMLREHVGIDRAFNFGEVRSTLNLRAEEAMRFLARLDAAGWLAGPEAGERPLTHTLKAKRRPRVVDRDAKPARLLCDGTIGPDEISELQAIRWLDSVGTNDLRLWHEGARSLREVLSQPPHGAEETSFSALARAVTRADRNTFAQEVEDVAVMLSSRRKGNLPMDRNHQWVQVFVARYVSDSGAGRSFDQVGKVFGVSRQRAIDICSSLKEQMAGVTVTLPATTRVLAAARELAPNSSAEMNLRLRKLLGAGAGVEAALNFATELGIKDLPVVLRESEAKLPDGPVKVRLIEDAEERSWVTHAFRAAQREVAEMGSANLLQLAGYLALEHKTAPGRQALLAVMERLAGFRWLDKEGGFFTFGDCGETSALAKRVRKIMAVAPRPVYLEEIASALVKENRWLSRTSSRATSVSMLPALYVLRELLYCWKWLGSMQQIRFYPTIKIGADVLSEQERMYVSIVQRNGGVATRHQIVDEITRILEISDVAVNTLMVTSPIVSKFEYGLYGLIARDLDDGALEGARATLREKVGVHHTSAGSEVTEAEA
jgi:hypothetical protein